MNDDKSWQKPLDNFLAEHDISTDNRVLARALSVNDEKSNDHDIEYIERALHIEENIAEIGLQPMPTNLARKLKSISNEEKSTNVIFGYFTPSWKKLSSLAAAVTVVALFNSNMLGVFKNQQPSLAEIQHAQQELAIALQYISFAKNISTEQINQTFNENIQQPLNQGLLKPLNHFKETS
jgi:hypothetical protein